VPMSHDSSWSFPLKIDGLRPRFSGSPIREK
jgi:hypothetical protein